MDGLIALSCSTLILLFIELNDERIYISLDLQSPILNARIPNNVSWYSLKDLPIHNNYYLNKLKNFLFI